MAPLLHRAAIIMQMNYVHFARKLYMALHSHCWPYRRGEI